MSKQLNVFHLANARGRTCWFSCPQRGARRVKQSKCPHLITYTAEVDTDSIHSTGYHSDNPTKISLLKSNLQKAVRRSLPAVALASAQELLKYKSGARHLLRRLGIIVLEDKFGSYPLLACHFNTLTWCLATEQAWTGWLLWLFHFIELLARGTYSENCKNFHHKRVSTLKWSSCEHVCALLLRKSYGGLKGDLLLLQTAAYMVHTGALKLNNESLDVAPTTPLAHCSVVPPPPLLILPAAVDFHSDYSMLHNINIRFPKLSSMDIKQAIWDGSSAIRSNRSLAFSNAIWNIIEAYVIQYQRDYITRLSYKIYES